MRQAVIERKTSETQIKLELNLDGTGLYDLNSGIGFFDHMLAQIARHGLIDLKVNAIGDLEVDPHHTVEDVGIVIGQAIKEALGERAKICRYGDATIPMDEALALVALDFGGRPYLRFTADLGKGRLGEFDLELVEEFYRSVAAHAGMNIHIRLLDGSNLHHCCEAIFKAFGRAVKTAVTIDERMVGIPSTKGIL